MKLPTLRKKPWAPNLAEIHEYTQDLQQVTFLRDKCQDEAEQQRYSDCVKVMQEVLIFLNTPPKKR